MNWLSPLVGEWMDRPRQYQKLVGDTEALPGAKVVAMVCAHMRVVILKNRKALIRIASSTVVALARDPVALL